MGDAERYVAFFKASLVFFNSYEELSTLWREQADNRVALGVSPAQEREMATACADRRRVVESGAVDMTNVIPMRPRRQA